MDKLDRKIIELLGKKADTPFLHIAKKLAISPATVQIRYERMKKNGAIFGTSSILDISKIGFEGKAFLFIKKTKVSDVKETINDLYKITNLFFIVEIIGRFEIMAMIVFRDIKEMKKIVYDIKHLASIEKVECAVSDESFYPFRKEYSEINPFKNTHL